MRLLAFLMLVLAGATAAAAAPFKSDRIAVEVTGKGPDVVLIPGLSSSPRVWDTTVGAVPGYRYHIVHVAGFDGLAPGANAKGPVVAPVGEEIARYIAEQHLRKPALVGHSMGGTLAMIVAARHPELPSRVMVVDMMPFLGAIFAGPNANPEQLAGIAAQMRTGIATSTGEARRTRTEQTIAGMVKTEAMRPVAVAQSLASDPAVSGQAMSELITTDLRPELAKIKVPMTVLWVVPVGAPLTREQLAGFYKLSYANAPQAVLTYVPDSAHFIMWDNPAVFRAELKAFLSAK
ncbi:MAG: alpha/beta hydrolase [Alphaproteobacteria bacterium]|nr:alpha/beta hydrolase [Alphaproteobacteria bacterium]